MKKRRKAEKKSTNKLLYWTPRVLGIAMVLFISLFALDVFGQGVGVWMTLAALLIHLVPTYLLVIALLVAWKREKIGAIIYLLLALGYIILSGGRQHFTAYLFITVPLLITGVLFALQKNKK
ncbi:hypothetical protein JXB11_03860 [Candidatus Woesearchaeota archaeon]|nr:hypothetical protein [Candidatus Woesearchaeota archaeon]